MASNFGSNYGTARFRKYYSSVRKWSGKTNVQKALMLGLSFFLVAFFLAFALRPTLTKISELRVEIEESEETLEKLEQKSQNLERIAVIWEDASQYIPALRSSLPIDPEYRTFIKELEVLASRHEVSYLSSSFDDTLIASQILDPYNLNGTLSSVPITVSFRLNGNWEDIKGLLEDMISIDRVLDIENMTITNASGRRTRAEDIQQGGLDVNVSGQVYYFADKSAISKVLGIERKK